jgi:hypothetical protein
MMGCILALLAGGFPRLITFFIWLARPLFFSVAFGGNLIWPLLGIIFLPFTTLLYSLLWTPGIGLIGFDWAFIIVAFLIDAGNIGGIGFANRRRTPAYAR